MRTIIILAAICLSLSPAAAGGFSAKATKLSLSQFETLQTSKTSRQTHATDDMSQDAELNMIQLQSLVSARQQAVQLSTQMLSALDCEKCIQNIGR